MILIILIYVYYKANDKIRVTNTVKIFMNKKFS